MENASNALMMAGGVLIGILLLSVLIVSFNGAADLAKSYDTSIATTSLQAFNHNFEKYTLGEVNIQSIITMTHFAKDYNTENELTKGDSIYISVICDGQSLELMSDKELIDYMQENSFYIDKTDADGNVVYKKGPDGNLIKKNYVCKSIQYNDNTNRVTKVEFRGIKI